MFERYNEPASRALFFARYAVSQLGATSIEPEHLLLGLIRENEGMAPRILSDSHISLETVRKEIEKRAIFHERVPSSREIPFSAAAQQVLRLTVEEADRLGHRDIGTEHLLLGLLSEEHSRAASILIRHGLRLDGARNAVVRLLAESPNPSPAARGSLFDQIDQISQSVERLAGMASDIDEAYVLLEEIRARLNVLKRDLGE
jgi:ATP-dependent Clp protease ATP-binding subunit ClpC